MRSFESAVSSFVNSRRPSISSGASAGVTQEAHPGFFFTPLYTFPHLSTGREVWEMNAARRGSPRCVPSFNHLYPLNQVTYVARHALISALILPVPCRRCRKPDISDHDHSSLLWIIFTFLLQEKRLFPSAHLVRLLACLNIILGILYLQVPALGWKTIIGVIIHRTNVTVLKRSPLLLEITVLIVCGNDENATLSLVFTMWTERVLSIPLHPGVETTIVCDLFDANR